MSTQILFIRHGETDWNRIKRIQGHIDIPLATSGIEQAQRLAQRLTDEAAQGARLDAIYSSDSQRAQQTARPFATALGLPLQLREGLRERSYGAFEGYDREQIAERYPVEFEHWQSRDSGFAPPDGESMRAFYHRVMQTVLPIVAAHPGGRVACVAHGGVLDCIYRFARDLTLEVPRDYALLNTSINVVDFEDGKAKVVSWADIAHLDAPSDDDSLRRITEPGR
jgi:2,3-bisphosphoglycerate-dependent phosphoglycerate mutase